MTNTSDKDVVTINWNGGSYTGEVSNGVPHGQGTLTRDPDSGVSPMSPLQSKYVGEWKKGVLSNGTQYDADGNIMYTFSDGMPTISGDHLRAMAKRGEEEAQFWLAENLLVSPGESCLTPIDVRYEQVAIWYQTDGSDIEKNEEEAVFWYEKLARAGDQDAQWRLSNLLSVGKGVEEDEEKAFKWLMAAGEQANWEAIEALSEEYSIGRLSGEEHQEWGFYWHQKAAEQNDEYAQHALADCYYFGRGVEQDYVEAVKWYRASADQGYVFALRDLGYCYRCGHGVDKDEKEAFKYFQLALEDGGDPRVIRDVGEHYLGVFGTDEDVEKAIAFYGEYAGQNVDGSEIAEVGLGLCYFHEEFGVQNYEEAAKWFTLAAENGDDEAEYYLAQCYEHGLGVEKDLEEAERLYAESDFPIWVEK